MDMSHSPECLGLDVDVRQELLSTMSAFNQSPGYCHPKYPEYILTDTKSTVDWHISHPPLPPPSTSSSSSSPGPAHIPQAFASQPQSQFERAFLRSSFSDGVFWPSMGDSFTPTSSSISTSNNPFGSSYHQYASSSSSSAIYQPTSSYGSMVPNTNLASPFSPNVPSPVMPRMLAGHQPAPALAPNVLQGSTPIHYPPSRPAQIPTSQPTTAHPYSTFSHRATAEPSQSASSGGFSSDMSTMMMLMSATSSSSATNTTTTTAPTAMSSEDVVAMGGVVTPSYDSEFLSSPSSATDDESLADAADKLRARQLLRAPPASDAEAKDAYLLQAKRLGMSYREIKLKGNFKEAESTLRGRYRTITKAKQERVRKPVWKSEDIILLRQGVERYAEVHTRMRARRSATTAAAAITAATTAATTTASTDNANAQPEVKVPWKKVSAFIAENGGSYRFGNATCKKKWFEITSEEQPQPMSE